jgi:hypothetical protein
MTFLQALNISRLTVSALVLNKYTFPMNAIHKDLNLMEERPMLESVRDLALQVSHSDFASEAIDDLDAVSSMECGMTLSKVLEGASDLKSLDLTWLSIHDSHSEHVWPNYYETERLTLGKCLRSLSSAPLQRLTLGGIHTTAIILCELFEYKTARDIKLEGMHIHQGSWTEVFKILTRPGDPFTEIYLDDLFDSSRGGFGMIFFHGPGRPKFPMSRGFIGPSTLHRRGDEVQSPIRWEFGSGRPLGSPEHYQWRYEHHGRFGPHRRRRACQCKISEEEDM